MKKFFLFFIILFFENRIFAFQSKQDSLYLNALNHLAAMLSGDAAPLFKDAVFITENAYFGDSLSNSVYNDNIRYLSTLADSWSESNKLSHYQYPDSSNLCKNIAVFKVIKDTIKITLSKKNRSLSTPFLYNHDDFLGQKEWSNVFVTTLLTTHKGNCHSLSYLYKILADELDAHCWLSFAPNHIYIKNRSQQVGWYNTELTSKQFPVDAWIMASGYVSPDAIRSGIYMDTLSNQQAIANCVLDLAKGYDRKYHIYTDSFIIKCCDLTLKYHPNNINAIIYKAETLRKIYLSCKKYNSESAGIIYSSMEKLYISALDLGYKEMPQKTYREWVLSSSKQAKKYSNKFIYRRQISR